MTAPSVDRRRVCVSSSLIGSIDSHLLQQFGHSLTRIEHACFDGVWWHAEDFGKFANRLVLVISEGDDFAMGSREMTHAFAQDGDAILFLYGYLRIVGLVRQSSGHGVIELIIPAST